MSSFVGHRRCISIFHRGFYFILLFENTSRDASSSAQEYHFEHLRRRTLMAAREEEDRAPSGVLLY